MKREGLRHPCLSWSSTEIQTCFATRAHALFSIFFGLECAVLLSWLPNFGFVLTLLDFIVGLQYGILMFDSAGPGRWALISCRLFMYIFSLGHLFVKHTSQFARAYNQGRTVRCCRCLRLPAYLLSSRQEFVEFVLAVFLLWHADYGALLALPER